MRIITSLPMAVLTAITASAMPAIQTPIEVIQPDSNVFMRTEAEYYIYALNDIDNLVPSKVIVHNEAEHSSSEIQLVSALEKDIFSKVDAQNGSGAKQTSDAFPIGANHIINNTNQTHKTWNDNPYQYNITSILENNSIITLNLGDIAQHIYSVAGSPAVLFGTENDWDIINGPEMTLNDDTGIYEWTSEETELGTGLLDFKVFKDHNWRIAYPPEDFQITVEKAGTYILYVTYNPETNEVTGELVQKHTYALAGTPAALFGVENDWDQFNAPEMTFNDDTGIYEWTSEKTELFGLVAFKVVQDHAWYVAYPPEDFEITAETPGSYTLYVTYNEETNEVTGELIKQEHTYALAGTPAVLFGTENDWDIINGPEMTLNEETGLYEWTSEETELGTGLVAFKVFKDHNWRIAYPPEDFEITAETPGTYTLFVTYNEETNEVTGELIKQEHTYALAGTPAVLFGMENDWDIINGPEMTLNEETSLYEWTSEETELCAGLVAFKVFIDHNWRIAYPPEDFEITAETPGSYTLYVTYNPETKEVCGTLTQSANGLPGDVNGDGLVTAADITTLYDILLNNNYSHAIYGDQTGDGIITAADVTAVYNILLLDSSPASNHAYVDLGLPSGTLWATMNIGASSPDDYGDYFAWGETQPKDVYSWSTYKWCNGSSSKMTKYCTDSSFGNNGFVDNKTELDPEDDAATVNWGLEWRIPTKDQEDELRNECIWHWTTQNGVNGYLVTSKHNGMSLFLPAAGTRSGSDLSNAGARGTYWSNTLYADSPKNANYLYFFSGAVRWEYYARQYGFSVRAVRMP